MLDVGDLSAEEIGAIAAAAAAAGAIFTALAAGAAWATARQGRHLIEAADRPLLEAQVLADPASGMLGLSVINTGRGVARGARFILHGDGKATDGVLGDGFVLPEQRVHVGSLVGPVEISGTQGDLPDLAAIVSYRDGEGFAHYRTHTGDHYTPKTLVRRRPKHPEHGKIFKKLFPGIEFDSAERVFSGNVVEWPPKRGTDAQTS